MAKRAHESGNPMKMYDEFEFGGVLIHSYIGETPGKKIEAFNDGEFPTPGFGTMKLDVGLVHYLAPTWEMIQSQPHLWAPTFRPDRGVLDKAALPLLLNADRALEKAEAFVDEYVFKYSKKPDSLTIAQCNTMKAFDDKFFTNKRSPCEINFSWLETDGPDKYPLLALCVMRRRLMAATANTSNGLYKARAVVAFANGGNLAAKTAQFDAFHTNTINEVGLSSMFKAKDAPTTGTVQPFEDIVSNADLNELERKYRATHGQVCRKMIGNPVGKALAVGGEGRLIQVRFIPC